MAQVRLYDLDLNGKHVVWSPNTCKTRFALNVKGIPFEEVFLNFPEVKPVISGLTKSEDRCTVPTIVDLAHGDKVVDDSWKIAKYLEDAYPDSPSLFHGNIGLHSYFLDYCFGQLIKPAFSLCILSLHNQLEPKEIQAWFRETRESTYKVSLEVIAGDEEANKSKLTELLRPVGKTLGRFPFVTGDQVGYADVALASVLYMLRVLRPELFESIVLQDDTFGAAFTAWWSRMKVYTKDE